VEALKLLESSKHIKIMAYALVLAALITGCALVVRLWKHQDDFNAQTRIS